jgi:hypothetical protein
MAEKLSIMIDGPKALELLCFAVAERGANYVYEAPKGDSAVCSYVSGDKSTPGCGVGLALHKGGVPINVLAEADVAGSISSAACETLRPWGVKLSKSAVMIFGKFQREQDLRNDWGLSLRAAFETANWLTEA